MGGGVRPLAARRDMDTRAARAPRAYSTLAATLRDTPPPVPLVSALGVGSSEGVMTLPRSALMEAAAAAASDASVSLSEVGGAGAAASEPTAPLDAAEAMTGATATLRAPDDALTPSTRTLHSVADGAGGAVSASARDADSAADARLLSKGAGWDGVATTSPTWAPALAAATAAAAAAYRAARVSNTSSPSSTSAGGVGSNSDRGSG